ncbi:hypothetical protein FRC04_011900 [Tulasnella sp. 424]|nr:hypothetical protein FRC04_011900 [Tulasnella sp. 424]KAG8966994.1 hypothetical protein FRC05_002308 [Tulasnella sp. 425]
MDTAKGCVDEGKWTVNVDRFQRRKQELRSLLGSEGVFENAEIQMTKARKLSCGVENLHNIRTKIEADEHRLDGWARLENLRNACAHGSTGAMQSTDMEGSEVRELYILGQYLKYPPDRRLRILPDEGNSHLRDGLRKEKGHEL